MATKDTSNKYGIKISFDKGPTGWVVGKDSDIAVGPLVRGKGRHHKALRGWRAAPKLGAWVKADDRYSWNCETVIAEFTGWGK